MRLNCTVTTIIPFFHSSCYVRANAKQHSQLLSGNENRLCIFPENSFFFLSIYFLNYVFPKNKIINVM